MAETDGIVELDQVETGQTSKDAVEGMNSEDGAPPGKSSTEIEEHSDGPPPVQPSNEIKENPNVVAPVTVEAIDFDRKATTEKIVKLLDGEGDYQPAIVLTGEAGVGKTWMAKAVSDAAEGKNCYGTIWISLDQKHNQESLYADIARQFSLLTNADEWDDEDNNVEKKEDEEEDSDKEKQTDPIDKALRKMEDRHFVQTKKEEKDRGKVDRCKYLLWVLDEGFRKKKTEDELKREAEEKEKAEAEAKAKAAAEVEARNKAEKTGGDLEGPDKEKNDTEQEQNEGESDAKPYQGKPESSDNEPNLNFLQKVLKWSNTRVLITTGRVSGAEITDQIFPKPLDDGQLVYHPFEREPKLYEVPRLSSKEVVELLKGRAKKYKYVPASTVKADLCEAIAGKEFLPADAILMLGALNCIAEHHLQAPVPPEEMRWEAQDPIPKSDSKVVATLDQVKILKATLKVVITHLVEAEGDPVKELVLCALEALQANAGMTDHEPKAAESEIDRFLHKWDVFRARGKVDNKYIKLINLERVRDKRGMVLTEQGLNDSDTTARSVLDCFWHSRDFFKARRGGVHYNELISYWILEGCFEPVDDLKKAYQTGHDVLMKLVDYGMIRLQEDNGIYMEGLDLEIGDGRFLGISATANLRMASMLEENRKWRGFGRITPADGMIKTLRIGDKKKEELVSTILVDGSGIHGETPEQLFLKTQNLHALGMFDAMLADPTYSIKAKTHKPSDEQKKPSDQPLSKDAATAASDQSKVADEVASDRSKVADSTSSDQSKAADTAASDQSKAADDAASDQSKAADAAASDQSKAADAAASDQSKAADEAASDQSMAADEAASDQSKVAEPTYALKESTKNLQVLVFRRCYLLTKLDFIQHLETLTALEVSGAILLKTIPDELFGKTTQLRSLNFSGLGVESLPTTLSNLSQLQRLILKNCSRLRTLPAIRKLIRLEVVDLGGCRSLEKMSDMCLKDLEFLEILDLSYTRLQRMPIINSLKHITQVLLKGCDNIGAMRKLKGLINLKHLNISGVNKVREIHEDFLEGTAKIEVVDLSGTGIEKLPPFDNPRVLNLKGCSKLTEPPEMNGSCLEFLDLSDASILTAIKNDSFEKLTSLQHLNLSNTKVEKLPSLNGLSKLENLLLGGCSSLEELPEMKGLSGLKVFKLAGCKKLKGLPALTDYVKLEELDLSGCENLSEVPALEHLKLLQKLNLSETQIKELPSLPDCGNLQSLVLRNCKNLEKFPALLSVSRLEELDLLGANNLEDVKAHFLNHLTQLRIMRLEKITAEEFSSISILSKLKEFSLNGWSSIAEEAWGAFRALEVLELSDNDADSIKFLGSFIGLHKLSVRGSKLTKLPSLKLLVQLESLDLSGTGIKELPEGILELHNFKNLRVPRLQLILDNNFWEKLTRRSIYVDCEDWEGSLPDGKKPYIMVQSTELFSRPEASNQLTKALDHINFSVHSSEKQARKGISNPDTWYDIQSEIRQFPPRQLEGQKSRCLEIQGFDGYPADATNALKEAECVSLVDNKFLSCISDLFAQMRNSILKEKYGSIPEANSENLHPEVQDKMTSCWLERCTEVTSIYKEPYTVMKVEKDLRFAVNLKILRISSLLNLKSFYDGGKKPCFENLEELYIDSCPMLETIFSSEQTMGSLHTLKIEFCGSLKTVFEMKELIPKIVEAEAEGEGKAETEEGDTEAEENKVEMQYASAVKLNKLYISHCPILVTVYSSDQRPEKMEDVDIKFCDELQSVFGNEDSPNAIEVVNMHLSNLPELISFGVKLQNCTPVVTKCPKLDIKESEDAFDGIEKEDADEIKNA